MVQRPLSPLGFQRLCGAPVTEYDCSFADGSRCKPFGNRVPCEACATILRENYGMTLRFSTFPLDLRLDRCGTRPHYGIDTSKAFHATRYTGELPMRRQTDPWWKQAPLMVRLSRKQRERLGQAADIESERRGEEIGQSTLLREIGMKGVERILKVNQ